MFADLISIPEFSNLTATAMLGWYAWHTVSKTIPEIVNVFRDEAATIRRECQHERELLFHELTAERSRRHHDALAIVESLDELHRRLDKPTE